MQTENSNSTVQTATPPAAAELEEIVRRRLGGRLKGFQLVMASQGLMLRGKVGNYYAKQLVQQTIMEVTSVQILANEIEVADREQQH